MPISTYQNNYLRTEEPILLSFFEQFEEILKDKLTEWEEQGDFSQLILFVPEQNEISLSQDTIDAKLNLLIDLVETIKISFDIVLPPPYDISEIQKKLDRMGSHHRREKAILSFQNNLISLQKEAPNPISMLKRRSMPVLKKQISHGKGSELNLDIEQTYTEEMQAECEVQVEDEAQLVQNQEICVDNSDTDQYGPLYNHCSIIDFILNNKEKYHAFSGEHPKQLWKCLASPVDVIINNPYLICPTAQFHTTTAATQHILDHYHQFQFGLDFNHLPKGFCLIKRDVKNEAQIILDYNPKQTFSSLKDDPLSISTHSILNPIPLAHSLLQTYLEKEQTTKGYLFIKHIYDALENRGAYDRKAFNLLLKYLPLLSNIEPFREPAEFAQWFFDKKEGCFRAEAFDYLFRHVEEIARVYPNENIELNSFSDRYDTRTKIIAEYLNHNFDPTHDMFDMLMRPGGRAFQAIQCCQHYTKNLSESYKYTEILTCKDSLSKQLLYILIEHDETIPLEKRSELIQKLHSWCSRLALTQLNLNNLTEIYQQYGPAGLKRLFNLWEQWDAIPLSSVISSSLSKTESLLAKLYRIIFKSCHTYLPLLEPAYNNTIQQIKSVYSEPKEVAHFWETLLTQHYQVVVDDDLSKLVNSFRAFRKQLYTLVGTSAANQLPTLEYPIKSLPVALSRILSLLEHCRSEDRLKQWKCMGSLDLSSEGVPQAMLHHYLFVLPEMDKRSSKPQDRARRYVFIPHVPHEFDFSSWNTINRLISFSRQKSNDAFLQSIKNRSCVMEDKQAINGLRSNFFEYIAAQSSALPLHFYQDAVKVILAAPRHPILLVNLYRYLAASTTNDAALYSAHHPDLLKSWEKFVNAFYHLMDDMYRKSPEELNRKRELHQIKYVRVGEKEGPSLSIKCIDVATFRAVAASPLEDFLEQGVSGCMGLPLPIFLRLMDHVAHILRDDKLGSPKLISSTLAQIKQALDDLATAAGFHKEVYLGLYNPFESSQDIVKDHQEISFLFDYCDTLKAIRADQRIDDPTKSKLIGLISTFQFKASNMTPLIDQIDSMNQKEREAVQKGVAETAEYASMRLLDFLVTLLLVHSVGNKEGCLECLTPDHLCTLLTRLYETIDPNSDALSIRSRLCSLIRTSLPDYYDRDCLEQLEKFGELDLSLEMKRAIQREFSGTQAQKQVRYFLRQCLLNPADVNQISTIFDTLLGLYRSLEKEPEIQKNLLAGLEYIAKASDQKGVEKLYPLLSRMSRRNTAVLDFIHFIRGDKARNNNVDYLYQRLSDYLDSMTQLRKQKLPVSVIERFSGLFERLLLDTQKKISSEQFKPLQDMIFKLIHADRYLLEPLFAILWALMEKGKNNQLLATEILSFLQYFTRCIGCLTDMPKDQASTIQRDLLQYGQENPEILFECLKKINKEQALPDAFKVDLLYLLSIFLHQKTEWNHQTFAQLLDYFKAEKNQDHILKTVMACYKMPPYMPLAKLIAVLGHSSYEALQINYDVFSREPHAREAVNCFDLEFAITQKDKLTQITLSEEDIKQLSFKIEEVKEYSMQVLRDKLAHLKQKAAEADQSTDERLQLITCLAELLYRSNSTLKHSFELNTTQYLAILAILSSNGRAIAKIATGEGKSRIMMILAASQYILGQTTDFVSSDFALAKRDYLAYSPFFLALGAEIRLITADSSIKDYTSNAIHFSDTTQLSHFRNRARISREIAIDLDESKRSLLIDEVDATLYDKAQTRFNYSALDKSMQGMEWIYTLLVQFVLEENEELDPNKFIEFVDSSFSSEAQHTKEQRIQQLNAVRDSQLQTWLESADKATQLKLNQHFVIKPDMRQVTSTGAIMTKSVVFVLHENRVYPDSRYSAGVHECLEAFLEIKRCEEVKKGKNHEELYGVLAQCKAPFSSKTEVRILCSSNTYDLFHAYQSGHLFGVTGTLGSEREKQEVSVLYQKQNCPIRFINVPCHKRVQRIDQPIRLAAHSKRQVQLLMEYIQTAHAKNQPVLLISQNLEKSNELFQAIKAINEKQPEDKRISVEEYFQQIPCDLPPKEENLAIMKAGQPGMITFGTNILGRGIDIPLQDEKAKQKGLFVLLDYLPSSERDYHQIMGRSGRYGALGETRLVVIHDDINFNYYLNSERWKEEKWQRGTQQTQFKRIFGFLFSNIYTTFQNKFSFDEKYLDEWSEFFKKYRDLYAQIKKKIMDLFKSRKKQTNGCEKEQFDQDKLMDLVNEHKKNVGKIYQEKIWIDQQATESVAYDQDQEQIEAFFLDLNQNKFSSNSTHTRATYHHYDPALDGRAKVYTHFFAETRAFVRGQRSFFANTRAALRREGILFADTRSALHGQRPWFANTRATLNKNTAA